MLNGSRKVYPLLKAVSRLPLSLGLVHKTGDNVLDGQCIVWGQLVIEGSPNIVIDLVDMGEVI